MQQPQVIIIGGGLAGLRAALELHRRRVPYLLLESSSAVGGRVRTIRDRGYLMDAGFQVYLTSYPEGRRTWDYDELWLETFEPGALIAAKGGLHEISDPLRRPSKALSTLRAPIGSLGDKARVGLMAMKARGGGRPSSPDISAREGLRRAGFSRSMIEGFFRPFFSGVLLEDELRSPYGRLWNYFRYFATGEAALPAGSGMQALPERIAAHLDPETIRLNTVVTSLAHGKVVTESGESCSPQHIILAADYRHARELLKTTGKRLPEIASRGTTVLYYSCKGADFIGRRLVINATGRGRINTLCVPSNVQPDYAPPEASLMSVSLLGVPEEDDDALLADVEKQVYKLLNRPKRPELILRPLRVIRVPHALPERTARVRAGTDRITVCGDFTRDPSINGALASGRLAAEHVARKL